MGKTCSLGFHLSQTLMHVGGVGMALPQPWLRQRLIQPTTVVTLKPVVANQAFMPHMKAMDVPFHLIYDSLICFKGLQSDRPKCKRLLADPGEYQNMIIKYLSVGLQS